MDTQNDTPSVYEIDVNAGAKSFEALEAIKHDISEEDYKATIEKIVAVQLHRSEPAPEKPVTIAKLAK